MSKKYKTPRGTMTVDHAEFCEVKRRKVDMARKVYLGNEDGSVIEHQHCGKFNVIIDDMDTPERAMGAIMLTPFDGSPGLYAGYDAAGMRELGTGILAAAQALANIENGGSPDA